MAKSADKEALASRIKDIESHLKLNSRQFALKIGMDPSQLSKIENAVLGLSSEYANKIYELFGVNTSWLLYGRGAKGMWSNVPHEKNRKLSNDQSIEITEEIGTVVGKMQERIIKLEASVTVILVTLAQSVSTESGKAIAIVSSELRKAIDEEADRLFDLSRKKS